MEALYQFQTLSSPWQWYPPSYYRQGERRYPEWSWTSNTQNDSNQCNQKPRILSDKLFKSNIRLLIMGVLFYKFIHDKRLVCFHTFTQNTDKRMICRGPDCNAQICGGYVHDVIGQLSVCILIQAAYRYRAQSCRTDMLAFLLSNPKGSWSDHQ